MNSERFDRFFELLAVTVIYIILPIFATLIDIRWGLICMYLAWLFLGDKQ